MAAIIVGVALAGLVLLAIYKICNRKRNSMTRITQGDDQLNVEQQHHFRIFEPIELFNGTQSFSEINILGQGRSGRVYKGLLSNGETVAVKHIVEPLDTLTEWEMRNISEIRHPNVVSLLGYCDEGDEYCLVYEYCSHGNLADWLFAEGKEKVVKWDQRLKIAIDIARGLHYLHNYLGECIIHGNIKLTNILLNEKFEAKLSSLRMQKVIVRHGKSHIQEQVIMEVNGTPGYLDPQSATDGRLTTATDVYSFGIVLLQLLSGRRINHLHTNAYEQSLLAEAKLIMYNEKECKDISEFADERLNGCYDSEAFKHVFRLGMSCTVSSLSRPSMEVVVAELERGWEMSHEKILAKLQPSPIPIQI